MNYIQLVSIIELKIIRAIDSMVEKKYSYDVPTLTDDGIREYEMSAQLTNPIFFSKGFAVNFEDVDWKC